MLESLLKNLQAEDLQHRCFLVKFAKKKNTFSYRTPPVTASAPPVDASVFFLKCTIKQLFRNLVMTYIFFLSTHRLMYDKSNSFVYTFAVNCQVF